MISSCHVKYASILCMLFGAQIASPSTAQPTAIQCRTQECFEKQAALCEPATFDTQIVAGGQARYRVFPGPPGEEECYIGFEFLRNPDPSLVGQFMSFRVDTREDLEPQLKEAVADCLMGRKSKYECSGPLWDLAGGSDKVEMKMASGPVCGVAVADEGEPLHALPRDGKWGYVTRDGAWAIAPQWAQAEPFSEGRAAVNGGGLFGIIDRDGNYVLEPFLESIRPFSEGCASATHFDETRKYLFVSRDGSFWHYDTPPEGATERGFGGFGDFSEGKAWFFEVDFGPEQNKYGWIDATGKVVIPKLYSGAGNFVDGLAPAAQRGDYWALMDETGEARVPDRWRFQKILAFSEGLAAVRIDVFTWMYMSRERIAFDKITYKTPDGTRLGPPGEAGIISRAGSFHDGLAPVRPKWPLSDEGVIFVRPDGSEAFTPARDLNLRICSMDPLPEFRDGLVRLLVANEAECDSAHIVYLDTTGKIVLEEPWREGDTDPLP